MEREIKREVATLSSGLNCSIVKANSVYGLGLGRKNFAKFLMEKLSEFEEVYRSGDIAIYVYTSS